MINSSVLVLNRYYQPVHVTSVKRAFSLLYLGVAKAIDSQYRLYEFADWAALSAANHEAIATVNRQIRVPRVVVLYAYEYLPKGRVRFSRLNIYARDHDTCQYCGKTLPRAELNLDHVVPRAQGGRTTWENVATACAPCNLRKGGRTPLQARMHAQREPIRPTSWQLQEHGRAFPPNYLHESWRDYLYWDVELEP